MSSCSLNFGHQKYYGRNNLLFLLRLPTNITTLAIQPHVLTGHLFPLYNKTGEEEVSWNKSVIVFKYV